MIYVTIDRISDAQIEQGLETMLSSVGHVISFKVPLTRAGGKHNMETTPKSIIVSKIITFFFTFQLD